MAGTNTRNNPGNKGKAKAVPEDRDALGDEGVAQAEREQAQTLPPTARTIARHLEVVRSADWSFNSGEQVPRTWWQRLALVLQRRGDVSEPGCDRCQGEDGDGDVSRGVFSSCVSAPVLDGKAFQNGACANCIWVNRGRSCSVRHRGAKLDVETVRQWLEDGENSLRTAIAREMIPTFETEDDEYVDTDRDESEDEDENNENEENVEPQPNPQQERWQRQQQQQQPQPQPQPQHEYADAGTFFGAFEPGEPFARVGHSQRGPRCFFDGNELRFPISREIWRDRARLAVARSDLAHFAAILDARLFEQGSGEGGDDYLFWNREARRLAGLYPLPGGWRQRRPSRVESSSSSGGGPPDDGNGGPQIRINESRERQETQEQPGPSRRPLATGSQRSPARDPRVQAMSRRAEAQRGELAHSQAHQSALASVPETPDSQPQPVGDRQSPIIVLTEDTTQRDVDAAIWANAPNYGLRNYLDGSNHNVEPEEAEAARQYYEDQYARLDPRLREYAQHQPAAEQRYPYPSQATNAYPAQQHRDIGVAWNHGEGGYHRGPPTYAGVERYPPTYPQPQPHSYSDAPWRQDARAHQYPPPPEDEPGQYPPNTSPILWGQRRGPFMYPCTPTPRPGPEKIPSHLRSIAQEPFPEPEEKPQSDPLPVQQSIEYPDQNRTQHENGLYYPNWRLARSWPSTRKENEPGTERSQQEEEGEAQDEIRETQQGQEVEERRNQEQQTQQQEELIRGLAGVERQDSQSGAVPTFAVFQRDQNIPAAATVGYTRSPSHSPSYQGDHPTGNRQPIFDLHAMAQAEAVRREEDRDREQVFVERAGQGFRDIATTAVDRRFGSAETESGKRRTARKSMYRSRNCDEEAEGDKRPTKRRRTSDEE
ncbi:hypothetical protein BDW69DRAFT_187219 [Aspergillus filifer]